MKQPNMMTWILAVLLLLTGAFGLNALRQAAAAPPTAPPTHAEPQVEREFIFITDDGIQVDLVAVFGLEWDMRYVDELSHGYKDVETSYGNIVIQRVFPEKDDLLNQWLDEVRNGGMEQKSGHIVVLNDSGQELYRFNIQNALPVRWALNGLYAETYPIEEIEFSVRRVNRVIKQEI